MAGVSNGGKKADAQMAGKVFEKDLADFNAIKAANNWTFAKSVEVFLKNYKDTQNNEKLLAEIDQGCSEYAIDLKAKIGKAEKSLEELFRTFVEAIREQQIALSDDASEREEKDKQIQGLIDERDELQSQLKKKVSEMEILQRANESSSALVDELKFKISNLASEQDYQELLEEKQDLAESVRDLENRIREMEIEKREAIVALREEFAHKSQGKNLIVTDNF